MLKAAIKFPADFIWGTATAAYQIEGAVAEDGRTPSIWDTFSHTPGKTINGETGDTACDHYHRLEEDLDLIADVVQHYRFSISWTRILPQGTGPVNDQGVDFYNRLIDGLIARGVTPWITLYHWDLPQSLQDKGGWVNRDIISWFQEYAETCVRLFGNRVKNWIIVNEPGVISWLGHGLGFHAPGIADETKYLACTHHLNLVIGNTYRVLKSQNKDLNIGSSYTLLPARPENADTPTDVVTHMEGFWNTNFFDPLLRGEYPAIIKEKMSPFVKDGDMQITKTALDFVGVQHYNAIQACRDDSRIFGTFFGKKTANFPATDLGWSIDPDSFHECLTWFSDRYGNIPLLVTENGAAFNDGPSADGVCRDARRINFLHTYINAVHRAIADGTNLKGYFIWSFMDNFEWSEGYKPRFGIVHVDYANDYRRTPKDSYRWYKSVVKNNGLLLDEQEKPLAQEK
jgi:beta-glucosidase